jgi:hypothetical protein
MAVSSDHKCLGHLAHIGAQGADLPDAHHVDRLVALKRSAQIARHWARYGVQSFSLY